MDGRTSALLGEFQNVEEGNSKGAGPSEVTEGGVGGERCSTRGRYVVVDRAGTVEAVLPCQVSMLRLLGSAVMIPYPLFGSHGQIQKRSSKELGFFSNSPETALATGQILYV